MVLVVVMGSCMTSLSPEWGEQEFQTRAKLQLKSCRKGVVSDLIVLHCYSISFEHIPISLQAGKRERGRNLVAHKEYLVVFSFSDTLMEAA